MDSPIKILPDNLTHIGKTLDLRRSKIEDLNNLERVDGSINLCECNNLKSLGKLRKVGGFIDLDYTQITKMPDFIVNVNGYLSLINSKIEDLNNLERVDGTLFLNYTPNLKSLGKLKYVGMNLYLTNSSLLKTMTEEEIRKQVDIRGYIYD
jgi:glutamine cyclotransferase